MEKDLLTEAEARMVVGQIVDTIEYDSRRLNRALIVLMPPQLKTWGPILATAMLTVAHAARDVLAEVQPKPEAGQDSAYHTQV